MEAVTSAVLAISAPPSPVTVRPNDRYMPIALSVFMSRNVSEARKLIAEKTELRNAELAAAERHFERLREGQPETQETTSLHLDVLRDLKRIHSHICSVAYPVLEAAGELHPSRLKYEPAGDQVPEPGAAGLPELPAR